MQLQAITHIPLSKDAYMVNENTIVIRLKVGKGDIKSSDVYYGDRVCMSEPILVKRVSMKKSHQMSYLIILRVKLKVNIQESAIIFT